MSLSMVSFGDPTSDRRLSGRDGGDLHHELILINNAIQLDTSSGLGALVRESVATEVARCHADMQRFLDKTKAVAATGVVGILNKVWWAASEEKELRALRAGVARKAALSLLIGSSNLITSTATRDEVRACRDTIQELTVALKPVPRHVAEDMVFIVDPLGELIRICMIYGLEYEDLHRIIQAYYPKERAGSRHIADGSYHLQHFTNGLVSRSSQSNLNLQPGMTFEMSMLLWERANFLEKRRTCPRCKQNKSEAIYQTGWRKCLRCSKFFQVIPDGTHVEKRRTACSFHLQAIPAGFIPYFF
ncbi:hypothetical protein B0H19DRAFT_1255600 [Mycena capillaripes]|nr:hypothetical protein B0H19DRAFT_1255600 [Mycena capillaripes]